MNILQKTITTFASFLLSAYFAYATEPSVIDYTCYPISQVSSAVPNIMVILDNSGSMNQKAHLGDYDHNNRYYGYFESYQKYTYSGDKFVRDNIGLWDGNFLNWALMRRIDIARKLLVGGLVNSRDGSGKQINIGEDSPDTWGFVVNTGQKDDWNVSPYPNAEFYFWVDQGVFDFWYKDSSQSSDQSSNWINVGKFNIQIEKDSSLSDEASSFLDGNVAGLIQNIGNRVRWGSMCFNYGTGQQQSGAKIVNTIGTDINTIISDIENTKANTWTPLAETYYTAIQYFKQTDIEPGLPYNDYPIDAIPNDSPEHDPFYNGVEYVSCGQSFVILVTDGASSKDADIHIDLKDFDKDQDDNTLCNEESGTECDYENSGTDYLDDLALYARTTDLRSNTIGKTELSDNQNLILYTIFTSFGDTDINGQELLKAGAKNGGFEEKDGISGPTTDLEWDQDNDTIPDTFFQADDLYSLETKLIDAINNIIEQTASETKVSIISTSEGAGNIVQAFFNPKKIIGTTEVQWLGYVVSLWIDSVGNLREDTNQNKKLDLDVDKVIVYFVDPDSNNLMIKRFAVSSIAMYPDINNDLYEIVDPDHIEELWEAGKILSEQSQEDRRIFTYIDKDEDKIADGEINNTNDLNPFDNIGELIEFDINSASFISPFLGIQDNELWNYLGDTHENRVNNLIEYIRGKDISGLRPRSFGSLDFDQDSVDETWKLGDIVHSTPIIVSKPSDQYHVIYNDESYQMFFDNYKDRETVVYVGANDGMLHAFTSWQFNTDTQSYADPYPHDQSSDSTYIPDENIGDELWAYIPQSVLPHLKWLPSVNYPHVYFVDLTPKVFDAKILADDTHYSDDDLDPNWGTFILIGLNLGGGHIEVQDDFDYNTATSHTVRTFSPGYALIDITEPREPRLMWERTYNNLELTSSVPTVVKIGDNWFAVFGSGPEDCSGNSTQKGHVFVVDLETGAPRQYMNNDWLFETNENNAFMNTPCALDYDLDFSVDAIYFGETYLQDDKWKGKVYRIVTSENGTNEWEFSSMFDSPGPVTAPLGLTIDQSKNVWIYGGTGRYLNDEDKTNSDTQYIFGIKDMFFDNGDTSTELSVSDLFNADNYTTAQQNISPVERGWILTLSDPQERVLVKPTILGGIVFVPSFVPDSDICSFGGQSFLYRLYFETGGHWIDQNDDIGDNIGDKIELGAGNSSGIAIYVDPELGIKGFIQQNNGAILSEELPNELNIESGLLSWKEE